MPLTQSPSTVTPDHTVALGAISPTARAASVPLVLGPNQQSVNVILDSLPPGQVFGPLGSIFVDNTQNSLPVTITFPDTQVVNNIPAASAVWILSVTGGLHFSVASAVAALTPINVTVLNVEISPTGVQPISGTIIIQAGTVAVSNQLPVNGAPASKSLNVLAASDTQLLPQNLARKFMLFQLPNTTDGWVNFIGGVAGPNLADCVYMQAGEKFLSTDYVPNAAIHIWITNAALIPCIEG